jgi:uncharacterized iron-regulated protein
VKDITPEKLASLNELGGSEANVATGYHAIEFLLWGQDLNGTGPRGNRPRRTTWKAPAPLAATTIVAAYLKAVTQLLVSDLEEMVGNWKPNVADNYRATLEAEPAETACAKCCSAWAACPGRTGGRAHEGFAGSQLAGRRAGLLQRQHPQLALLRCQRHS